MYKQVGETIFSQGSDADTMLIIAKGKVGIEIDGKEVRVMRAPDVMGEKALAGKAGTRHIRSATAKVVSSGGVELMYLKRKNFDELVNLGVIDAESVHRVRQGSQRWASSTTTKSKRPGKPSSVKVLPQKINEDRSNENKQMRNKLAQVREQFGANSDEYKDAVKAYSRASRAKASSRKNGNE